MTHSTLSSLSSSLDCKTNAFDNNLASQFANPIFRDENILKGIYQMRFTKPSKIQERALPLLLNNPPQNMIGQSQSGTGKTAAFVLNMLSRLDLKVRSPQALVLAPSRELARQILGVIQVMGQNMEGLLVDAAIPADREARGRHLQGHIIVGTPGTTTDLIRRRQLDTSKMKVLVLDEADNMLDQQGLGDQCHRVRMYVCYLLALRVSPLIMTAGCCLRTFRSSCSQLPSQITSSNSLAALLPARIRSPSSTRSSLSRESSSSILIVPPTPTNTMFLSSSTDS